MAAAIVEDDEGGRVFVHGNLAYAWDGGDTAARRFAAVSLIRIKAATQAEIAEGFGVSAATVRRWEALLADAGLVGLLGEPRGPKRKSKLTADTVAAVLRGRQQGLSYREIADEVGVSQGSIRNAIILTESLGTEQACPATTSEISAQPSPAPEPVPEPVPGSVPGDGVERQCPAVPVLTDPLDRGGERVLAAFGMIPYAAPVFTAYGRDPLAGLFLAGLSS